VPSSPSEIPATGSDDDRIIYKVSKLGDAELAPIVYGYYSYYALKRGMNIESQVELMQQCERIAKWMVRTDCKNSLMILGEIGVGKTTMMHAMKATLRSLYCSVQLVEATRLEVLFRDFPDTYEMLGSKSIRYLFIDDVGTENTEFKDYGTPVIPFVDIINARYDANLPTIITSNLRADDSVNEFAQKYGERVADRLHEMANKLTITGNSHRK